MGHVWVELFKMKLLVPAGRLPSRGSFQAGDKKSKLLASAFHWNQRLWFPHLCPVFLSLLPLSLSLIKSKSVKNKICKNCSGTGGRSSQLYHALRLHTNNAVAYQAYRCSGLDSWHFIPRVIYFPSRKLGSEQTTELLTVWNTSNIWTSEA